MGIENCRCTKYFDFGEKYWRNQSPPPFRRTFWLDKWGLCEGYGGPNLCEKGFQLFQLFIDRDSTEKYKTEPL